MPSSDVLVQPDGVSTSDVSLCSRNGFEWHLTCTSDPLHSQVIPVDTVHPATVPGTLLADLSKSLPDPFLSDNNLHPVFNRVEHASFCYRLSFILSLQSSNAVLPPVSLSCLGLDTIATVTLNAVQILNTDNAFHPHIIRLNPELLHEGINVLTVHFDSIRSALSKRPEHIFKEWNDPVGGISKIRTPQYVAGWDWGPRLLACGIVRPVRLIFTPIARILDVACLQNLQIHQHQCTAATLNFFVDVAVNNESPSAKESTLQLTAECRSNFQDDLPTTGHSHQVTLQIAPQSPAEQSNQSTLWNDDVEHDPDLHLVRYQGSLPIDSPKLWWPNCMGPQNLYNITVSIQSFSNAHNSVPWTNAICLHSKTFRIGLRQLRLVREETPHLDMIISGKTIEAQDESSPNQDATHQNADDKDADSNKVKNESFTFEVNGRPFFVKGSNYIPTRVLYAITPKSDYEDTLQSACDANMNMLRVWGGGVYADDAFYETCDKLGMLLWHDFMFSCSLYPGDDAFIESCGYEAKYQTARLRNHPCMALWCGNNELEQAPHEIMRTSETKAAYDRLFYEVLADVVEKDAGDILYWPCSPHNPEGYENGFNNPRAGDTHFWDVWHDRKPVAAYLQHQSRFCSEFGMQSYLSEGGARRFAGTGKGALNVFNRVMESHQKNAGGNLIIQEYCQRQFQMASNYSSLAYQSQINQALCMRTGVEHFRRNWPYCGGAMYWQLNDCWPCFSWSSIEYGGNWKALHFAAKRFFGPLLVSIVHHGEESVGLCNLIKLSEDTGIFSIHATYDGNRENLECTLSWSVFNFQTNKVCDSGLMEHTLGRDSSNKIADLNAQGEAGDERDARDHVVRAVLSSSCGKWQSYSTGWFCSPRLCNLPNAKLTVTIAGHSIVGNETHVELEVASDTFAPFVELWFKDVLSDDYDQCEKYVAPTRVKWSDNYFDLFPSSMNGNDMRSISVIIEEIVDTDVLQDRIGSRSLVESYMT